MEINKKKQEQSFVREALIISVSTFAVKIIGVLLRIPLSNILDEAMGAYTAAYAIYAMLYMISTAGLPVAISKMIAEASEKGKKKESQRIFFLTTLLFGIIGLAASLFMFLASDHIADWSDHSNAALAMKVIAPTLFLICISSAVRGYFQGLRYMVPTAISQFIEAAVKMCLGIGGALYAAHKGYGGEVQAAFATVGLTVGVLLGTVYLILCKTFSKKRVVSDMDSSCDTYLTLGKRIAVIALPVTITSSALYLSNFMDTLVINKSLISSGFTESMAEKLFAAYTTYSTPISELLPSTLVYPIAISILPSVSGALAAKKVEEAERNMINSIRISGLIALPCSAVLCALAKPCIVLLFGTEFNYSVTMLDGSVKTPLEIAAPALSILALGIFFISLVSTTNSLLQACGKTMFPVISVLTGVVLLIICEINMVGNEKIGIFGAPISSIICYVTAFTLNFVFLRVTQGLKLNVLKLFWKNLVSAIFCGAGAFGVYKLICNYVGLKTRVDCILCLVPAGITAVVIYVAMTLLLKGTTVEEVELLPRGRTLSSFLKRKNLL